MMKYFRIAISTLPCKEKQKSEGVQRKILNRMSWLKDQSTQYRKSDHWSLFFTASIYRSRAYYTILTSLNCQCLSSHGISCIQQCRKGSRLEKIACVQGHLKAEVENAYSSLGRLVVMKGVCGWIIGKTEGKGEKLKMQKL